MLGFRIKLQRPPKARSIKEGVVKRFEHVYEVDPEKMTIFQQQEMPVWDTLRIVSNRHEYLKWMHEHFAKIILSAEELEKELIKEGKRTKAHRRSSKGKNRKG